ncbi:hypothetical protein COU77_01685 [Candidatus Peregrinibacteria bacterium CG10_big_fil_rev_8_21_14_0_10_49_16]|nr:MAG: hypothetical protein COU77_01685 [Candidatus Peregrinibacteria bacterium CG10_big_fil_rev_8_21_14_0_10_49_16]
MPVHTHWIVFGGSPSSGKTTTLRQLIKLGHKVIPDTARAFVEFELSKGKSLQEIRGNPKEFQPQVAEFFMERERNLSPHEHLFLDYGLPDALSFSTHLELDIEHIIQACQENRYQQVFLFDRLPLERDNVRTEDERELTELDLLIDRTYREMGYEPIRVPPHAIDERVSFILAHLTAEETEESSVLQALATQNA